MVALAYKKFATMGIIEEMAPDTKVTRLGAIVEDLRRKVTQLKEQVKPSTSLQVIEERREETIEVAKKIEKAEEVCVKDVDQVS